MKYFPNLLQRRETRSSRSARQMQEAESIMFPVRRFIDIAPHQVGLTVDVLGLGAERPTLGRVASGGHEIELEDPDNITLLVSRAGRIDIMAEGSDHAFGSGRLILVQAGRRKTRVVAPGGGLFRATTLQIPRRRLADLIEAETGKGMRFPDRPVIELGTSLGRQLAQVLPQLADDVFGQHDRVLPQRALTEVECLIDDLLVEVMGQSIGRTHRFGGLREFHRVSQACDIMQARSDEPLSMADLALELGTTQRSLQLSFRAAYAMSPRQYLEQVRLDRVRAMILSQDEAGSVTKAALDCGFMHLGRFSQSYRRTFGELPSETLARQRHLAGRITSHSG